MAIKKTELEKVHCLTDLIAIFEDLNFDKRPPASFPIGGGQLDSGQL
jgi:hypothetical protein